MSDYYDENPKLFTTGSFKDIAKRIDEEWWEDKRKKLQNLSGSIDVELLEYLPPEVRAELFPSPEIYDEENPPDDSWLMKLQKFKGKKGKKYKVVCSNKLFRETKKLNKKEKNEVVEIVYSLSTEPSGSSLPRPQNVKRVASNQGAYSNLSKSFSIPHQNETTSNIKILQYKCGQVSDKRCLWYADDNSKKVIIFYYGTRNHLNNFWK